MFVKGLRSCGRFFARAKLLQPRSAEGSFGGSSFCGFEYVQSILASQFWASCGASWVPASQLGLAGVWVAELYVRVLVVGLL